ncbi:MAG: ABC transporter permease subunit [Actinomycetota bacterium]
MTGPVPALAGWEFRAAVRSRWVLGTAVAFAALAMTVTLLGLRSIRGLGLTGAGPTSNSLVNLGVLLPSLMGLLLGAGHLASAREQGLLSMIGAQPISRRAIVLGSFAGLTGSLWATIAVGFGAAALVISGVASSWEVVPLLALVVATLGLSAACVAIGVALSAFANGRTQALALSIVVWIIFAFGIDLALAAVAPVVRLGPGVLLTAILLNPIEAARVLALLAAAPDGTALGPFGSYLIGTFGREGAAAILVGALAVWTVAGLWLAQIALRRKDL